MRWRLMAVYALPAVTAVLITVWVLNAHVFNHWLAVHTGTINEPGPYYGFWSGFGSDIAEFAIVGTIATGVYQLVRKYNCHQPGCWRVGNHPAAGGQFMLCYRHHPDYQGQRPTAETIARLHRDHVARQLAVLDKLQEVHQRVTSLGSENK